MSKKTQVCYAHVFAYIDKQICPLNAQSFMTDYEDAMRNAISGICPTATVNACWFHFCQAVKRYGAKIGGFVHYMLRNVEAARIYYKLMCLPLLPVEYIVPAFNDLEKSAVPLAAESEPYSKFIKYFKRQWIERVCIPISYPCRFFMFANCFVYAFPGRARCDFCCTAANTHD